MNLENRKIDVVINRLDEIISWSISNNSRIGYFASLYKRMTIAVKNGIENNVFEDGNRMEKLDVIFANRYLAAFDSYQNNQPLSVCWKKAFDACQNDSVIVMQHLLLGINAHINLDLGIAAAKVAEGNEINSLKNDFEKINDVIKGLVNEVQNELSEICKPMLLLDKIGNNNDEAVANFSIGIARKEAWGVAVTLSSIPLEHQTELITKTDLVIAQLSEKIINPRRLTSFILKIVKWFEPKEIGKAIHILNR